MTDRTARVTESSYDNRYRKTLETWKTGATVNRTTDFTYDSLDNLTAVNDSYVNAPDFSFTYDARNQVQLESQTVPGLSRVIIDRDYNTTGQRVRTAVNIGGTVTAGAPGTGGTISGGINDLENFYSYDRLYRLASVSQGTAASGTVNSVAPKFA